MKHFVINSLDSMERAVTEFGVLPFFHNPVRGLSIAEMCEAGLLFGGDEGFDGCWEWKGPVIQMQTAAYGKFFRRKAGFIALDLLPHFLNYRRKTYPVKKGSTEESLLGIISEYEGLTSTELRKIVNGKASHFQMPGEIIESKTQVKRSSLESPLQRLQMGVHLLIADFEYKHTKRGERYGWGVALYSTPEIWFDRQFEIEATAEESLEILINQLSQRIPWSNKKDLMALLR